MSRVLKIFATAVLFVMAAMTGPMTVAQPAAPVKFNITYEKIAPDMVQVTFEAEIAPGWHVYSTDMPEDGPIPASLVVERSSKVSPAGELAACGKEIETYDNMFGMTVKYFENSVKFIGKFKVGGKNFSAQGYLEYAACNDEMCIPPSSVDFSFSKSTF